MLEPSHHLAGDEDVVDVGVGFGNMKVSPSRARAEPSPL